MFILGISSTTKVLSVALVEDDKVLAEFNVAGKRAKAENITFFVKEMLKKAKFDIGKVDALAVAQGPGSYGGIRGGVTSAKSFAQVLKVSVIGVSTLEAMAYNFIDSDSTVLVILDAKRNELNVALFAVAAGKLKRLTDDFVIDEEKLSAKIKNIKGKFTIASALKNFAQCFPRASNVALIAKDKVKSTGLEGFLSLIPKYSHKSNITAFKSKK